MTLSTTIRKLGRPTDHRRRRDGRLVPPSARRNERFQIGLLLGMQIERGCKGLQRVRVGALPLAALERADRVQAEASLLRELLLRQAGSLTQASQGVTERLLEHAHVTKCVGSVCGEQGV